MTDDASPENLRKFLESDDPAIRRMGLSMAEGSKSLDKAIIGLCFWDPEEGNRKAAAELVEGIGLENITEFPEWLEPFEDVDFMVRVSAVKALGNIGDKRAVNPLIKALEDEDVNVRNDVAEALGNIGDKRAVEPLIKALEDEDWGIRCDTAEALGNIGDKRAVEPLIKALEDEDGTVRFWAAEALGNIGYKRAVGPLIKALGDEDEVSYCAVKALGKIGGKRAVGLLIKALGDEDDKVKVRRQAARALGDIGDKRAAEPLIKALEDKNRYVRYSATIALVKITKANIKGKEQENIIKFLESDDEGMVTMATSMLKGILEE